MSKPIRILIADDHTVVRKGLCALLVAKPGFEVIGEAADGYEAVSLAATMKPDVILMDLVMPHKDGITAIREIKDHNPEARILVLTSFGEDERIIESVKAGALSYLLKESSPDELLQAIELIHRGQPSLDSGVVIKLVQALNQPEEKTPEVDPLTNREIDVLKLVAEGHSNQYIGLQLQISERTVGTHISNMLTKLHLENRTQLALYALRNKLAEL